MDTNILNTIFLSNTTFNFSDFADFSTLLEMLTYDSFKSAQNVFCYRTKIFIFVKSFLKNCYIEFTYNIDRKKFLYDQLLIDLIQQKMNT